MSGSLVVEATGIGFTEPLPGSNLADAGRALLRARELATGTIRWERDVNLVPPTAMTTDASLTAGDEFLAVPLGGRTTLLDLSTGDLVRSLDGTWRADRDLLIGQRSGPGSASLEVIASDGSVANLGDDVVDVVFGSSARDVIVTRRPDDDDDETPLRREIVDRATGETRFTLTPTVVDADHGLLAVMLDGDVQLVDGSSGEVRWTWSGSDFGLRAVTALVAADVILVIPVQEV
jgi:hypothetical protein